MGERQPDLDALQAAKRAYEIGRVRWSARQSVEVLPIGLSALILGAPLGPTLAVAGLLFVGAVAAGWWSSEVGRGAVTGAWVGLVPLLIGGAMGLTGGGMSEQECYAFCLSGSTTLGAVAGVLIARRAAMAGLRGPAFGGAALVTALLAASLGCFSVGFGTLFGLATGLVALGVPAFWRLQHA